MIDPAITPTIRCRFSETHEITLIPVEDRDPSAFPALRGFDLLTQRTALAEFRDEPLQWAFMRSINVSNR